MIEMKIKEYDALVKRMVEDKSRIPFPNGGAEHARSIIAAFFECAKSEIRISTKKLAASVSSDGETTSVYGWPRVIDAAVAFLRNDNARLYIASEENIDESNNSFIKALSERNLMDKVIFKKWSQGKSHVITMDEHAYRMETDQVNYSAIACANNKADTKILNEYWSRYVTDL